MKITPRFMLGMVAATAVPVLVLGIIGISLLHRTTRDIISDGEAAITRAHHRTLERHVTAVGQGVAAFFADHAAQLDLLHSLAHTNINHHPDLVIAHLADLYPDQDRAGLPGYGFIHPQYGAYANWQRRGHQGSPWIRRAIIDAVRHDDDTRTAITRRLEQLMPLMPAMAAAHHPRTASCDLLWCVTVDGVAVTYPNDYAARMASDPAINELDESQEEYVRAFAPDRHPSAEAAWTTPYIDTIKQQWMISRIAPLYEGEDFIGTIGLDMVLGDLTLLLQSMAASEPGYLLLLDDQGRPLAMSQEAIDELAWSAEQHAALIHIFITADGSASHDQADAAQTPVTRHPDAATAAAFRSLFDSDSDIIPFAGPHGQRIMAHAPIADTGWVLACIVPTTVIDAPVRSMRTQLEDMVNRSWWTLLSAALTVALVFSLIGAYLGLQTTRPITDLIHDVDRISRGEDRREIRVPGNDELADLAHSVNRMIHTIIDREQRFKTLFDNISDAVFIHDADSGAILAANGRIREMFGYEPHEAPSLTIDQLSLGQSPYSIAEGLQYLQQARAGQRPLFEWKCRHREGAVFWVEISMRQTPLGNQQVILVSVRDISDRKKKEAELLHFRTAVESASDAIGFSTPQGRHFYQNPAFDKLFGDIGPNPPKTLYADSHIGEEVFATIMAGRPWSGEVAMRAADGHVLDILLRAYACIDGHGEISGLVGIHTDISNRKAAEQALRDSETRLRVTLDSIGDGVIATDLSGHVVRMNPVAERLSGWNLAEARDRTLDEVFHIVHARTREAVVNPVAKVLEQGEVVGLANHTLLIARDGSEYHIKDSGAPIRDDQGAILGVVLVFSDVSEEYRLQEQLDHSRRMDAIGQLAGGVAHDFNNMLGGIVAAADMLLTKADQPPKQDLLEAILASAERAADLCGKLLLFSRRRAMEMVPVNVHDLIDDVASLLAKTIDRRITIDPRCDSPQATITADSAQLHSALLNLGINASQAMVEGGTMTFATSQEHLPHDRTLSDGQALSAGTYLALQVSDTGCGIDPALLDRIFTPFFTTKPHGTGLGLAAVYGTVHQHGGAIEVISQPGAGTTFTLWLPLAEQLEAPVKRSAPHAVTGSGTILVVDDEAVLRTTATAILTHLGYQVLVAENGRQALEIHHDHPEIDLVMLDMVMPEMNGIDCLRQLRCRAPDLPVILATGYTDDTTLASTQDLGVQATISKPYRIQALAEIIAQVLSSGSEPAT